MSDVYTPPKAELRDEVEASQYGSVERALAGDYQFNIVDVLKEAWEKTKGAKTTLLIAGIIPIIIAVGMSFIFNFIFKDASGAMLVLREVGGQLLISVMTLPMYAGVFMLAVKRSVGAPLHVNEIFQYWHKILPLIGLYVVMYLMIMLGFILLVLPGIYLIFAYSMAIPLMVEKDMGIWQALETSRKTVTKKWFTMFGFFIAYLVAVILGAIALLVGLLWVMPAVLIAYGIVYRNMFGIEEKTLKA